jgi:hypothetical protein
MPDEVSIKGQTVISFLKFLEQNLSQEKRLAVLQTAPAQYRDEFSKRMILATSTYPMSVLNGLTIEAAKAAGEPVLQFARRAGRFSAKEGVLGVYRVFVRVLSTNAVISKAAAMWSTMNSAGKMSAEQKTPNSAVVRLTGFPSPHPVMCARVTGWIEQIAGMTGASPTVAHTRCAAEHAPDCEWTVSW